MHPTRKFLKPEQQAKQLRSTWKKAVNMTNSKNNSGNDMLAHLNKMNQLLDSGLLFSPTKPLESKSPMDDLERYEQLQIQHAIDLQITEQVVLDKERAEADVKRQAKENEEMFLVLKESERMAEKLVSDAAESTGRLVEAQMQEASLLEVETENAHIHNQQSRPRKGCSHPHPLHPLHPLHPQINQHYQLNSICSAQVRRDTEQVQ